MVERRQLHMHTRNFIFLFFRLLNLRGATAPIAPPPLATPLRVMTCDNNKDPCGTLHVIFFSYLA